MTSPADERGTQTIVRTVKTVRPGLLRSADDHDDPDDPLQTSLIHRGARTSLARCIVCDAPPKTCPGCLANPGELGPIDRTDGTWF